MRQPGAAPDVIVAEVVNGLRTLVHANRHTLQQAITTLSEAQSLPIRLHASSMLAQEALLTAIERGLSGYDALYATLSELLGEPLVTADRRLADAVPRSILVA